MDSRSPTQYEGLELLPEKGSVGYAYVLSCVAAVGGLLFGFDFGVISGAIEFIEEQFALTANQKGFVASCAMIGCIVGTLFAGYLSDKFGRKKVLIGTAFFFAVSAIFCGIPELLPGRAAMVKLFAALPWFANSLPCEVVPLVVARFIGGLAVGVASMVSPMYIAEIAPARIRGRLVSINQFAIILGINLSYFTNWLLVNIGDAQYGWRLLANLDTHLRAWLELSGQTNWRWMFAIETVPALALFVALWYVPETPRWLTRMGRVKRSLKILARIDGREHARREMDEIQETLAMESEKASVLELLKPGFRVVLFIGVSLAVFQQISGANTVLIYAPSILKQAVGSEADSALMSTVWIGIISLASTVLAIMIIDKVGRRPLMLIGSAGMSIALLAMGLTASIQNISPHLLLVLCFAYIALYSVSLAPVTWVLLSEIFPTNIRGRAMSVATFSLWVSCFFVLQTFPPLHEKYGERIFFGYSVICALGFVFVLMVVRETKGRTLEQIERSWRIKRTD